MLSIAPTLLHRFVKNLPPNLLHGLSCCADVRFTLEPSKTRLTADLRQHLLFFRRPLPWIPNDQQQAHHLDGGQEGGVGLVKPAMMLALAPDPRLPRRVVRPFQIQRQQPRQNLLIAQVVGPAVDGADALSSVPWAASLAGRTLDRLVIRPPSSVRLPHRHD